MYERSWKNKFQSITNSGKVLNKLKSIGFRATGLPTYDFSTLYTTLSHTLIKERLFDLIERAFKKIFKNEGTLYLACNDKKAIFTSTDHRGYELWSCQNVCDALSYFLDEIYNTFGNTLYRQIVDIPMSTNCAPLVAVLFLFCYERDFTTSLSDDNQPHTTEEFISTSKYLDNLLNIDNPYFEGMGNQIYPPELQSNKAIASNTESPFFIYTSLFLFGHPSYGVYISQLIRFSGVRSLIDDCNARNKCLIAKLLKQGYRYHKRRKSFSKFYRRHHELVSKFNVGLKRPIGTNILW